MMTAGLVQDVGGLQNTFFFQEKKKNRLFLMERCKKQDLLCGKNSRIFLSRNKRKVIINVLFIKVYNNHGKKT